MVKTAGIINLKTAFDSRSLVKEIFLNENILIKRDIKNLLDNTWSKWLGKNASERINNSNLFLIYLLDSENSDDNQKERTLAEAEIFLFFTSLIINDVFSNEFTYKPYIISGIYDEEPITIQSFSELQYPVSLVCPNNPISVNSLNETLQMYYQFREINNFANEYYRVIRGIKAFIKGIESKFFVDRIHMFIRSLEAFIFPPKGDTKREFKNRVSLLTKITDLDKLCLFYNIRSNVEHMHHPFKGLTKLSDEDLQKITFELEIISRIVIKYFLLNKDCWELFMDSKIEESWGDKGNKITSLWDLTIDLQEYSNVIFYVD